MKKILFRADAKPSIGIGDLMSLLHLSAYLEDFECYFLTQATSAAKDIMDRYKPKNLFWLEENACIESDVNILNKLIAEEEIDIVFFEITERKLTDYVGINRDVKKVCINFDGYIFNDIKLLINWDVVAHTYYDVNKFPNTKFLLGSKYVILPKVFYSHKIQNRKYTKVRKKILIAMGGADEFDFTSKVVNALLDEKYKLIIIVGAGYTKKDELINLLNTWSIEYEIKVNVQDMLSEYMMCDFAVGAGGLTSSELVASRTPCALLSTYEHQIARCEYFDTKGWGKYLGFREFNVNELRSVIENFNPMYDENIFETQTIIEEMKRILVD